MFMHKPANFDWFVMSRGGYFALHLALIIEERVIFPN